MAVTDWLTRIALRLVALKKLDGRSRPKTSMIKRKTNKQPVVREKIGRLSRSTRAAPDGAAALRWSVGLDMSFSS